MSCQIIQYDCVKGMKLIPDASIDCVIADPPYNINKQYGNNSMNVSKEEYCKWAKTWIVEAMRILKDDGTCFIYGYAEILSYVQVLCCSKWNCRYLQWHYTNKACPGATFWQRSHESILVVWKKDGFPVFDRDAVRVPYTAAYLKCKGKKRKKGVGRFESAGGESGTYKVDDGGALPRDVIHCAALAGGAGAKERCKWHPTQKPLGVTRTLLKSIGENKHVVIPFAGSGTEAVICKVLGHVWDGFDLNPEYVEKANFRVNTV